MTKESTNRFWCSELLKLHLESKSGRFRSVAVNLEEIWPSGALVLTSTPIPQKARLRFACGKSIFRGQLGAQTFTKGLGYFAEIKFDADCQWSLLQYRPKHLLNPLVLLANRIFEAALRMPSEGPVSFPLKSPFAAAASTKETVSRPLGVWRVA